VGRLWFLSSNAFSASSSALDASGTKSESKCHKRREQKKIIEKIAELEEKRGR